MYQTNDIENEISIKDCFKNLAELAIETKNFDENLANKFFDILVECLGIDFRMNFVIDNNFASDHLKNTLRLNSFCGSSEGMKSAIERSFSEFYFMVHEGKFSNEYLEFLKKRRVILEQLINYQSCMVLSSCSDEMTMFAMLNDDMDLLDKRISLVSENLETRGR